MANTIKTVAVTGASGFVGRTIVRALVERGYHVRALCRDHEKARATLPLRREVQIVVGDVHDDVSPDALCKGADAVIHLIGIIRPIGKGQTFERMHPGATRVMVEAATRAGITRFIHMSALGVTIDGKAEYQRTKAAAENIVRRSGLEWTVFRPGLIHGREGELTQQIAGWCTGDKQPWILIPYFARMVEHDEGVILGRVTFEPAQVAPVSVHCVAACFIEALTRPATIGEVYNVVGSEELSFKEMLAFYRDGMPLGEKTLPIAPVPGPAAVVQAKIAKALGFGNFLPFDEGMAHMATQDATASLDKLKAHLGITPAPFRATAGEYVASL